MRSLLSALAMLAGIGLLAGFLNGGNDVNVFLAAVLLLAGIGLFCSGLILLFLGRNDEEDVAPKIAPHITGSKG